MSCHTPRCFSHHPLLVNILSFTAGDIDQMENLFQVSRCFSNSLTWLTIEKLKNSQDSEQIGKTVYLLTNNQFYNPPNLTVDLQINEQVLLHAMSIAINRSSIHAIYGIAKVYKQTHSVHFNFDQQNPDAPVMYNRRMQRQLRQSLYELAEKQHDSIVLDLINSLIPPPKK